MARTGANYSALNGSKLEYKENSTYKQIYGLANIPDIGGTPNRIDTTDLDNTKFETSILGLQPALQLDFDFNMEDPSTTANIKLVSDMEDAEKVYDFRLTYKNGITVEFSSEVRTTLVGGASGDLSKFTLHLAPKSEPTITIPTSTSI